jgi:hypothetical protein
MHLAAGNGRGAAAYFNLTVGGIEIVKGAGVGEERNLSGEMGLKLGSPHGAPGKLAWSNGCKSRPGKAQRAAR